jgi:hypothetical protein
MSASGVSELRPQAAHCLHLDAVMFMTDAVLPVEAGSKATARPTASCWSS